MTGAAGEGGRLLGSPGESALKHVYSKVNAENADDLVFRNNALLELGMLYLEKCDFTNSSDCFEKVKTEALQFHLYDNYFKAVAMLLRIHAERLDFDKHGTLMREALQVGGTLASWRRYLPKLHYNQGIASMYQRDMASSLGYFQQSRRVAQELLQDQALSPKERAELQRDVLKALYGEAVALKDEGKYPEAITMVEALERQIQELHGKDSDGMAQTDIEASALVLHGHIFFETRQLREALEKYWAAHAALKTHRNWSYYYYVLFGLGRAYQAMGNAERAKIFFDLILDAIGDLELNALKRLMDRVSHSESDSGPRLQIDRERKVVVEKTLGEVHFERRFVLLEILYLLAGAPGKVFSKEDLVNRIWRENYNPMIHDSKVYTSISRLRKLIEPDFRHPIYVLNERDGYAFNPAIAFEEVKGRRQSGGGARKPVISLEQGGGVHETHL
ncbi:MAG: winged helix-turn-helix domain-containing protein [Bdellovibrionales bacterium]|nr:winged helix-turn-helix domain-containing protein [Bdellovibrionales bacterium]